jgi:hypothetical protein
VSSAISAVRRAQEGPGCEGTVPTHELSELINCGGSNCGAVDGSNAR